MTDARAIVEAMHDDLDLYARDLGARSTRLVLESMERLRGEFVGARLGPWGDASKLAAYTMSAAAVARLAERQRGLLVGELPRVARASQERQAEFLAALDKRYLGAVRPLRFDTLAWLERQTEGQIRLRQFPRSFARYGAAAVQQIEDELAKLALVGRPWTEARGPVWRAVRGIVRDQQWMVDRILRTETSAIYNGTALAAMLAEDTADEPMMKTLVATFDARTGWDSVAVHGQIRPVREFFRDPVGRLYLAPPNRPHDREIVVAHRSSWGERADWLDEPRGELGEQTSAPEAVQTPTPAARRRQAAAGPAPAISRAAATVLLLSGQLGEARRVRGPQETEAPDLGLERSLLAELERARLDLAAARFGVDARDPQLRAGSLAAGEVVSAGGLAVKVLAAKPSRFGVAFVFSIGDTSIVLTVPQNTRLPFRRVRPTLSVSAALAAPAAAAVAAALRTSLQSTGQGTLVASL